MRFAAAVVAYAAAAVVAVPTGKYLVELSLPDAQDYNPNQSLYPQRSLRVIGAFESYYTEETFRTEAIKQCKAEHACSSVIGYLRKCLREASIAQMSMLQIYVLIFFLRHRRALQCRRWLALSCVVRLADWWCASHDERLSPRQRHQKLIHLYY